MMKKILCLMMTLVLLMGALQVNFADASVARLDLNGTIQVGGQVKGTIKFDDSVTASNATIEMTDQTGNKLIYVDSYAINNKEISFSFRLRDWVKAGDYQFKVTVGGRKQSFVVKVKSKPTPNNNNTNRNPDPEEPVQEQIVVKEKENKSQKVNKKKPSEKLFIVAKGDVITKKKGNRTVKSVPSHAIKAMLDQAKVASGRKQVVIPVSVSGEKSFGIELASTDIEEVAKAGLPVVIESEAVSFTIAPKTLENIQGIIELDVAEVENEKGLKAFDFTMTSNVDGASNAITTFDEPMEIALDIDDVDADHEFMRVFYVHEDGSLEFMGGRLNADGQLVFETTHFSEYIVKEERVAFEDEQPSWAKRAIEVMASQHVIDGYDGKFHPADNVTKAQFAKLIVEAMGYETSEDVTFTDVKSTDWFAPYLAKAVANGIITNGGTFEPNSPITREEMAVMLGNTVNYTSAMTQADATSIMAEFSDLGNISNASKLEVAKTINEGIMGGVGDGLFDLDGFANRAQAATVIYRLFEVNK